MAYPMTNAEALTLIELVDNETSRLELVASSEHVEARRNELKRLRYRLEQA
jgi:hypothetical protein